MFTFIAIKDTSVLPASLTTTENDNFLFFLERASVVSLLNMKVLIHEVETLCQGVYQAILFSVAFSLSRL